jgi:glycosyltransferase involved in cell wall biosynthesis
MLLQLAIPVKLLKTLYFKNQASLILLLFKLEQNIRLKICIVFKGNIFDSSAASKRILSLSGGLKFAGAETLIFGFSPFPNNKFPSQGSLNTIFYSYPKIPSIWFPLRVFVSFIGLLCRYPKFIFKNKVNIIYLYNIPLFAKWIIISYKIIFSYIVVEENNEYPLILLRKSKIKQFFGKLYIIFAYKLLDGMVVMTKKLLYYFKPLTSLKTKFEIINMTVDVNRFINIPDRTLPYCDYLAYCGGLNEHKDGIITLIQAFSKISTALPELKLVIIGKGTKIENDSILSMIQSLMVQKKVILIGFLSEEEFPLYLLKARALLLPRPNSFQNEGNFPTKLGEYLATGNPVIATRVGEIQEFLIDGQNAFIAESGSVESLASKMIELLSDFDKAKIIGKRGKQLTFNEFNHIVQSEKLFTFFISLYNKAKK